MCWVRALRDVCTDASRSRPVPRLKVGAHRTWRTRLLSRFCRRALLLAAARRRGGAPDAWRYLLTSTSQCLVLLGALCVTAALDQSTRRRDRDPDDDWGGGSPGRKRRREAHDPMFIERLLSRFLSMNDKDFRRQLRVSKSVFHDILTHIVPVLDADSLAETNKRRRKRSRAALLKRQHLRPDTIPSEHIVAIALYQMGLRGETARVADTFRVSESTVRSALRRFCRAVVQTWGHKISFGGVNNINALGDRGGRKWGLPGCIGAIDGKRFRVRCH
jgi:hypothetical protein